MKQISDFYVGQSITLTERITSDHIVDFVKLSGDTNRIHTNEDFASSTSMGKPVAHGMINISFISMIIGTHLPGHGAVWVSNSNNFLKPCRVNDTIKFKAVINKIEQKHRLITICINAYNQLNECVLESHCEVYWPEITEHICQADKSKAIMVLGGTGGIGSHVVTQLYENTEQSIIVVVRSKKRFAKIVPIERWGKRITVIEWEYASDNSISELFSIVSCHSENEISGFVNCIAHGTLMKQDILDTEIEQLLPGPNGEVSINLRIIRELLKRKLMSHGSIVLIGSAAAHEIDTDWISYSLSKNMQSQIMKKLAKKLGGTGIRVNEIVPGFVKTNLISHFTPRSLAIQKNKTFLKKLSKPEEVASTVNFLLSEGSSHISGQSIRVDGGI